MKRESSEQQIAAVVVKWLEALGADVYQEVECSGGVADIVARVGAELWIVEVKTSCSLALLIQTMERRRLAHRVYVAAPYSKKMRESGELFRELGVGLIRVDVGYEQGKYSEPPRVSMEVESRRWNTRPVALAATLCPEHKTHAKAGAIGGGGRWTPFRSTCEQLRQTVVLQPGITLKAAIESTKHHYRSNAGAKSSLAKWIEAGKVPGVAMRRSHGTHGAVQLYPAETP